MLLVPYPFATENHQEANARELERAGAARVLLDADLTPDVLARAHPGARGRPRWPPSGCEAASAAWGKPDADERAGRARAGAVATMTAVRAARRAASRRSPCPSLEGVAAVHLIGVGGAGMRNLARLFLARGVAVTRLGPEGLEGTRRAPKPRRRRSGWATTRSRSARRTSVIVSSAIRETNPELAESAPAGGSRCGRRQQALAALGAGHRVDRGRGDARQDDDDLAARGGPGARGARPHVPDRRRPERERQRSPLRRRRPLRLRGRRERRVVPARAPVRRRGHERRGRSRRLLPAGAARRSRRRSPRSCADASTSSPAATTPASARRSLESRRRGAHLRVGAGQRRRRHASSSSDRDGRARDAARMPDGREVAARRCGSTAPHNLLNAAAAIAAAVDRRRRSRRWRPRRCARSRACTAGSSSAARPAGRTSSTTTATRRPRWR